MDAERISIAETCLHTAHDGGLSFPEIVGNLIAAGFGGYMVDYRCNSQTDYLPDGDSVTMDMQSPASNVAAAFNATEIERLVRWAQANPPTTATSLSARRSKAQAARDILSHSGPARRLFRSYGRDPCRALSKVTGHQS